MEDEEKAMKLPHGWKWHPNDEREAIGPAGDRVFIHPNGTVSFWSERDGEDSACHVPFDALESIMNAWKNRWSK